MRRVTLPGPLTIWSFNAFEAKALHRQIFVDRAYERHGITIREGDTIFDVGANTGLFSLYLSRTVSNLRIYAFEPVPDIYTALERNLAEYAPAARCYNIGCAERSGEAVFEFDRFSTMTSTMHPGLAEKSADRNASAATWAAAGLADLERIDPGKAWVRLARRGLENGGFRPAVLTGLSMAFLAVRMRRRLFLKHLRCKLKTISELLAETGADQIDLLKIDAEGAEEAILAGIADSDWSRIRQLAVEVNSFGGRVERMTALLTSRGFRTVCEYEDWATLKLLGEPTLYAVR